MGGFIHKDPLEDSLIPILLGFFYLENIKIGGASTIFYS